MKSVILFFVLLSTLLYSQKKKSNETIDSVNYYIELAKFNTKTNNYKAALNYTQKAIDYAIINKNNIAEASAYSSLGFIYFELKKYDDAIYTFNKSIALFDTLKPSSEAAFANYGLGLCYMEKGDYSTAEINFDKANSLYSAIEILGAKELINLQKGIIYKAKGRDNLATSIFSSIISRPDNEDVFKIKAEALYQIGTIELKHFRNNLAINYFKRALKLNLKNNDIDLKSKTNKALSVAYEKISDIPHALFYLKNHLVLKDSITRLNKEKLEEEDYVKFKKSEQLKTIAQMDKEKKQQEKANKFSKLISILAIALISILSLLSLMLYKNNINRNKSNLVLKEKNKELEIARQKAEKASKARSEFLSTVSHELRTPLNAINGISHLLLEEKPKKSQMNYLLSLKFSGEYLTKFINDILEINKIDSNKVEVENIRFNLKQLLEDIQNSLKELATANNINFKLEIDSTIPDNLIGDPMKLSQIFMNLINNALKFTQNGSVSVIAKLLSLDSKDAKLFFEVKDTGIGIAEDKFDTVFESFSQGSVEINRKYGGTGLGLTIVKKLIKILGSQIKLESKLGEGSSFSFELKFKVDEQNLTVETKPEVKFESNYNNKKVLLVEDNKINQMITKKMLENKGIYCEIIDNGEDAVVKAKDNKFDLILMDVHLPGINGTIATQQIREFDTKTPVIALTAISLHENRETLMSFGMNEVITKPFVPEDFYAIIAKYV